LAQHLNDVKVNVRGLMVLLDVSAQRASEVSGTRVIGKPSQASVDETMPVWADAERHQLHVKGPLKREHRGMNAATAAELRGQTLRDVRRQEKLPPAEIEQ
jgi:hypothetical protein